MSDADDAGAGPPPDPPGPPLEPPPEDARTLDALRHALGPDPMPAGLVDRAAGLVELMDLDRELVALLDESAEPVGARGAPSDGTRLRLESADGRVAIEITVEGDLLAGQVLAGDPTEIVLERTDGSSSTTAPDQLGRFSIGRGAPGPVRLRLQGGFVRSVTTDWFLP